MIGTSYYFIPPWEDKQVKFIRTYLRFLSVEAESWFCIFRRDGTQEHMKVHEDCDQEDVVCA